MPKYILFLIVLLIVYAGGCTHITETVKVIWGSSTKALERARKEALTKTYVCSFQECFDAVLTLAFKDGSWSQPVEEELQEGSEGEEEGKKIEKLEPATHFAVFIKNTKKRYIVVMGVRGSVDTTEVGIFFDELTESTVKLEVASLSSNAKRAVSEIVFKELDLKFTTAN
jgi:hypothetical protein